MIQSHFIIISKFHSFIHSHSKLEKTIENTDKETIKKDFIEKDELQYPKPAVTVGIMDPPLYSKLVLL